MPASDLPLERARRTDDAGSVRDRTLPELGSVVAPAQTPIPMPHGSHAGHGAAGSTKPRAAGAVVAPVRDLVVITNDRAEDDVITDLLRGLLRARSPGAAVELLHMTIRRLGATLVPASHAGPDAMPLDVSIGEGPPLLPVAEPMSVARLQLERILPRLLEDTRAATALLRQRERIEGVPRSE